MKLSLFLTILFSVILLSACEEHTLNPTSAQLRGEKITYHFNAGFSYRILQYDDKGKVKGLVSGVTYTDEEPFENTYELIYEGESLKEVRSLDPTIWSFEYTYGKNGQLSETKVFLSDELKEFYAFSYDTEGHLVSEISWGANDNAEFLPISQHKYRYDSHHNLIENQLFLYDNEDFKLISTTLYKDFDDKINSEHQFMNNLHHPFVRFCKNNPRTIQLTNSNGTSAEQKFLYDYNSRGYVTKRRIENESATVDFEYKEVK
jgi:hypothetical protein